MSLAYHDKVSAAVESLKNKIPFEPEIIIMLGTGLGGLASLIERPYALSYESIPYFQKATVDSHCGNLVFGELGGKRVAALQGRLHFYEGYSTREITFPIRVLTLLGASHFIVSNAAGGLNPNFQPGSLMTICDHLNFIGENPLRGENIEEWGPRFPDMSETYDKELQKIAIKAAQQRNIRMERGVYACIPGPSLETPAETRFYRNCGADAIGMSTVPEVIVARHAGLKVLGISVLANINDPDNFKTIILEDVLNQIKKVEDGFKNIVLDVLKIM